MIIQIETVPFNTIPNGQVGDWRRDQFGTLQIRVAEEIGNRGSALVAIHELIEVLLCEHRGITCEEVDKFDASFIALKLPGEAGDHPNAPYRREHFFATNIERLLAAELDVDWQKYDDSINNL